MSSSSSREVPRERESSFNPRGVGNELRVAGEANSLSVVLPKAGPMHYGQHSRGPPQAILGGGSIDRAEGPNPGMYHMSVHTGHCIANVQDYAGNGYGSSFGGHAYQHPEGPSGHLVEMRHAETVARVKAALLAKKAATPKLA